MVQCSCFVSEPLLFRTGWRLLQYPPRQALRDCILCILYTCILLCKESMSSFHLTICILSFHEFVGFQVKGYQGNYKDCVKSPLLSTNRTCQFPRNFPLWTSSLLDFFHVIRKSWNPKSPFFLIENRHDSKASKPLKLLNKNMDICES